LLIDGLRIQLKDWNSFENCSQYSNLFSRFRVDLHQIYLSGEIGATPSAFQYNSSMNWEKQIDQTTHYIHIDHIGVVFGSTLGSGHTDNAGTASYAEFLAGRFQDDIRRIFGENVLKDVIASVRSVENDPIFAKKLRAEQTLLDALSAIPLDAQHPSHQRAG